MLINVRNWFLTFRCLS